MRTMKFSVFTPLRRSTGRWLVVYYLADLTCTEETFGIKAGARRRPLSSVSMLVAPDTSLWESHFPVAVIRDSSWRGALSRRHAGAVVEALPHAIPCRSELPAIVIEQFPSMIRSGGASSSTRCSGTARCDRPQEASKPVPIDQRVSADLAPRRKVPWDQKAQFYLGPESDRAGDQYDATESMMALDDTSSRPAILIDQGLADQFLENQLHPHRFGNACRDTGRALTLRRQPGTITAFLISSLRLLMTICVIMLIYSQLIDSAMSYHSRFWGGTATAKFNLRLQGERKRREEQTDAGATKD